MKRVVVKFVVYLILGVIVNIAIAWGCAMWSPTGSRVISAGLTVDYPSFGFTLHGSKIEVIDSSFLNTSDPFSENLNLNQMLAITIAGLVREATAGWPLRCLKCDIDFGPPIQLGVLWPNVPEIIEDPIITSLWRYGIAIPPSLQRISLSYRDQLPIRPIWQGFAINTIFFTLIVWILWSSLFAARNFIRIKRGLCIKCGYDLHGAEHKACPECGQA